MEVFKLNQVRVSADKSLGMAIHWPHAGVWNELDINVDRLSGQHSHVLLMQKALGITRKEARRFYTGLKLRKKFINLDLFRMQIFYL